MSNTISTLASVSPQAELAEDIHIDPFAVIEAGTSIGAGCRIGSGAVIKAGSVIGKNNTIGEHAVIGGAPQDLHFDHAVKSGVKIGDSNIIRELATIHRSAKEGNSTLIGSGNFLMAVSHIAHDVIIHDDVIIANNALIAGHVEIFSKAFISGGVTVHQFVKVGAQTMVGGLARVIRDTLPYSLISEDLTGCRGINLVGLKRTGASSETIKEIKKCYTVFYNKKQTISDNIKDLKALPLSPIGKEILEFIENSERGITKMGND